MKKTFRILPCIAALLYSASAFAGDTVDSKKTIVDAKPEDKVSTDIFSLDSTFTGESNVHQLNNPPLTDAVGRQSSLFTDFNYGHRIHIQDHWYLRLGVEYQRYDFGGSVSPLPNHLQSVSATIAYEYIVQDFAAVAVELHPGVSFENDITGRNFDVPIDIYTSFKIKEDKLFGMVGVFYGTNFSPSVTPIGGIIWLINDKTRLEAIFPRPALVYSPNDNWEFRAGAEIGGWAFRVDKNGRTPATHAGSVLQYTYYNAGLQAIYKGWKGFEVGLGAGYNFEREFDFFRDGPGQKYRAGGAPYVKLSIGAKF